MPILMELSVTPGAGPVAEGADVVPEPPPASVLLSAAHAATSTSSAMTMDKNANLRRGATGPPRSARTVEVEAVPTIWAARRGDCTSPRRLEQAVQKTMLPSGHAGARGSAGLATGDVSVGCRRRRGRARRGGHGLARHVR